MVKRRSCRALLLGAVAATGLLAGHWLAYVVALPAPRVRGELLSATGHGYWSLAVKVAVALGLLGIAAVVADHLRRGLADRPERGERFSFLLTRLGTIQILAFLVMETMERLVAGAPVAGMLHDHLLVLGLAFQVLTACVGALVLLLMHRVVSRLVAVLTRRAIPRAARARRRLMLPVAFRPARILAGAAGVRGPPSA